MILVGLVGVLAVVVSGTEIQLKLPAAGTRCLGEELQAHDLLVVKADTVTEKEQTFTLVIKTNGKDNTVSGAGGNVMYKEEKKTTVSHAFTTTMSGAHWVCVTNTDSYKDLDVMLSMKSGVAAKDYSKVAQKDHLEPAQLATRRIQDLLMEYRSNLFYQRRREETMREVIDSTADRALAFCIFNVVLIVLMGFLQAYFFRRFFRSKKII